MKSKTLIYLAVFVVLLFISSVSIAHNHSYHNYGYYVNSSQVFSSLCNYSLRYGLPPTFCVLRDFGSFYYRYSGHQYDHHYHHHNHYYNRYYYKRR